MAASHPPAKSAVPASFFVALIVIIAVWLFVASLPKQPSTLCSATTVSVPVGLATDYATLLGGELSNSSELDLSEASKYAVGDNGGLKSPKGKNSVYLPIECHLAQPKK